MIDIDLYMVPSGAPAFPERDLWWEATLRAAPDVSDFTERHRRGVVRLPWTVTAGNAGAAVEAWVCCDPACGGVELNDHRLSLNHGCCYQWAPDDGDRRHAVGLGALWFHGYYHGPFTAWWEPL